MKINYKRRIGIAALCLCAVSPQFALAAPVPKAVTPEGTKGGLITEGFQLTAQVEQVNFMPAAPIVLTVTLKNTTDKTLSHLTSRPEIDYPIEVKNKKGEIMPLTRYGQRLKKSSKTFWSIGGSDLVPGEEVSNTFIVNRVFDMTDDDEYTITVTHPVPKLDGHGITVNIVSNVVHLTVGEPPTLMPIPLPK